MFGKWKGPTDQFDAIYKTIEPFCSVCYDCCNLGANLISRKDFSNMTLAPDDKLIDSTYSALRLQLVSANVIYVGLSLENTSWDLGLVQMLYMHVCFLSYFRNILEIHT